MRNLTLGGSLLDWVKGFLASGDSKLARDHEAKLFAYIDKLSADRTSASSSQATQAPGDAEPSGSDTPEKSDT
jgi:hypothetical protein